jgi:hypothetical protein
MLPLSVALRRVRTLCPYDISTAPVPLFTQPLRRPDYPRAMIDVLLLATTVISFVFFFALVRWFDRI